MLDDKTMVSDALASLSGELTRFCKIISTTEHIELKQCLKQMRSECERSHEKLYQVACEKNYCPLTEQATPDEISHVKSILTGLASK